MEELNESSRSRWRRIFNSIRALRFFRSNLTPEEMPLNGSPTQDNDSSSITKIRELIINPQTENEEEIARLLQTVDPNTDFDINFEGGNSLIHEAVIHKKPKILRSLLLKHDFNLKAANETGDTPMISLFKACVQCGQKYWDKLERDFRWENGNNAREKNYFCEEHASCLKILYEENLEKDTSVLFEENELGLNAISYATMCPPKLRLKYFTILFSPNTAQQIHELYKHLNQQCDSLFVKKLQKILDSNLGIGNGFLNFMWKDTTGEYTLLQITCRWGMKKSMKYLLTKKAKTDHKPIVQYLPIQIACYYSHPDILNYLIKREKPDTKFDKTPRNQNLFHSAVKDITDSKRALECLKILLKIQEQVGDINDKDDYGRTPLHYAVMSDDDDCIVELLENKASLFIRDRWGETPLMNISRSAFQKFLDNMITDSRFKGKAMKREKDNPEKSRSLIFNYEKLIVIKKKKEKAETGDWSVRDWRRLFFRSQAKESDFVPLDWDPDKTVYAIPTSFLCQIKETTELQKTLAHPVLSIIIYFKWLKCRSVALTSQLSFLVFTILYTCFVVLYEEKSKIRPKSEILEALFNHLNLTSHSQEAILRKPSDFLQNFFLVILSILLFIFFLLEFLKIINQKICNYFFDFTNLIRIIGVVLSIVVLAKIHTCPCSELKAFSVLFTWLDFAFTVGQYPGLALYISIFRQAILRLTQFLIVYSGLLIGFALSFYFLFESKNSEFSTVLDALFKTLGILSGDFGADNIPFKASPFWSHAIFILYIFVTTLILINIMAEMISRVKLLSEKPFLHKMLAQVDIIKHYEDNYTKNKFLVKLKNCFRRKSRHDGNEEKKSEITLIRRASKLERTDFKLEITLNGKKNELKHSLIFENYPQETVRFERIDENPSKLKKVLSYLDFVELFDKLDPKIIHQAKKIIKKKSEKREKSKKEEVLTYDKFMNEINFLKQKLSPVQKTQGKQGRGRESELSLLKKQNKEILI